MAFAVCIEIPEIPSKLSVTWPGMGELVYMRNTLDRMPRPSELVLNFLNGIAPAMGSIYMFIRVIDVLIAVFNCIKAIPEAIPFNPGAIFNCLTNLFEKIAALAQLIPPLAYIVLIADIVHVVRLLVEDILLLLVTLDARVSEITSLIAKARTDGNFTLLQIGECAKAQLRREAEGVLQIFELIGKVLALVTVILDILASLLPAPAGKKIREAKDQITGANSAVAGISITDFPPLGGFLTAATMLHNVLLFIEQFLKAIVGLEFISPNFTLPTLQNA